MEDADVDADANADAIKTRVRYIPAKRQREASTLSTST